MATKKCRNLLAAFLFLLVMGGMVGVLADRGGNQPNARIPIDIDNDCLTGCCEAAGGHVEETNGPPGGVCHINEDSPNHNIQVATFNSCAQGC